VASATCLAKPSWSLENQRVGVVRVLNRLDEAVLPERWRRREQDPVKVGLQHIYLGGVVALLGLVLLLATGNLVGVVVGSCNMLIGAARMDAAMRSKEASRVDG